MASATRSDWGGLIVTRTPLRVSFAGGGTDLPEFYRVEHGAVYSSTIDKYIYVVVKRHGDIFGEKIRLNYYKSEHVLRVDEIENDVARECLRFLDIEPPIYISTVADVPASTGLGASSSFAVGLLNALHYYRGERVSAGQLAAEASHIEIDVLGQPVGKQDQYAAAFGGLNFFSFHPDGSVRVEPQILKNGMLGELFTHLLLFWTGYQRDASSVLSEQKLNTPHKMEILCRIRQYAYELRSLGRDGDLDPVGVGRLLGETWERKRHLASTVSNAEIDHWYRVAIDAGAEGGKLCGAGGGGFLLFIVRPSRHEAVRQALHGLLELPVAHEVNGSQVVSLFSEPK